MNREKIGKLIETLRTYPEFYDQGSWGHRDNLYVGRKFGPNSGHKCGTRACLAGYTVMMEGYSLLFQSDEHTTTKCHKGKKVYNIDDLAAEILGLNEEDSAVLFGGCGEDWRHEEEFLEAHTERKIDVAVKELEDLLLYGSYELEPDEDEPEPQKEPEPEPVSEPVEVPKPEEIPHETTVEV